jgi:hypothetical protein
MENPFYIDRKSPQYHKMYCGDLLFMLFYLQTTGYLFTVIIVSRNSITRWLTGGIWLFYALSKSAFIIPTQRVSPKVKQICLENALCGISIIQFAL